MLSLIGYFPNLNHAPTIIAREKELLEAQIAAGFVGPDPAMNSFTTGVDVSFGEILPTAIFVRTSDWIENIPQVVQKLINTHKEAVQAFGDASFDLKFLKEKPDFTGFVDQQFLTK